MSLKHGILGLLNYGEMTGYELDKAFKESLSFFWRAQTSQLYRELAAMEKTGWIAGRRVIQSDKPNKRVFSLTDAGRAELTRWLAAPQTGMEEIGTVRSAFLMRMFFIGELGDEKALEILRSFREKCLQAQAEFATAVGGAIAEYGAVVGAKQRTKYWKIVAMSGEGLLAAELAWAEKAIALLEEEQ